MPWTGILLNIGKYHEELCLKGKPYLLENFSAVLLLCWSVTNDGVLIYGSLIFFSFIDELVQPWFLSLICH